MSIPLAIATGIPAISVATPPVRPFRDSLSAALRAPACASQKPVVVQDATARIYEGFSDLYGCAFGQRVSYDLGPITEGASPEAYVGTGPVVLAGVDVAYCRFEEFYGEGIARNTITVRNLQSGRVIFQTKGHTYDIVLKFDWCSGLDH